MVEVNKRIHWVPGYVGERRFGNWLEGARDWAISRNRYWGSCLPVWECDSCDETVCVGSIDDLEERSGVRLDDLHKHFVDPVTFPCATCEGTMTRIPEVLDCWFESGSMPYAQKHYPFENRESVRERPSRPTSSPKASTRRAVGSTPWWCFRPPSSTRNRSRTSWSTATSSPRTD